MSDEPCKPGDGMNDERVGDDTGGMAAEFVDAPDNEPGSHEDPPRNGVRR